MLNTIKITVVLLVVAFLMYFPKISYAWEDHQGHDGGHSYHRHGFHPHVNPDLTLVTGMDNIDTRVLVASGPDQLPETTDQTVPEGVATTPVSNIGPPTEGDFVIFVPNHAGGYTPVHFQKWGNGYLGPRGELYYPFPPISELKAMYGI